jgi:DNA-binding NarL/FixJ family response regulator
LRTFERDVDAAVAGTFQFLGIVGEPGSGKTRMLRELAAVAARRGFTTLWGRATEFEQELPFGVLVDALDDHLEESGVPDDLGGAPAEMLATVFPALAAVLPGGHGLDADLTGLGRYRFYRTVRQLIGKLAEPSGLVLVLDDLHWADDGSVEFLDHLARHPPRGRVLVAVAYRQAQASPYLIALAENYARQTAMPPLTLGEVEEFLGARVSRSHCRTLHEVSGGIPFYLDALARMDEWTQADQDERHQDPAAGVDIQRELPPIVRAALQVELDGLSPTALLVTRAAAVVADQFEPALIAVAAEVPEAVVLEAFGELDSRDIVRPAESAGRFRFRHPLVRRAAYSSAAAGWRLAAHARIAGHLAGIGAPPTVRAHHVERSGRFGDRTAISTLVDAARTVAPRAPAAAAHWLDAALQLMPVGSNQPESRPELLLELARAQSVSGQVVAGRNSAREVLRLLAPDDHPRRVQAAKFCAQMERKLDRPDEARALLLDELRLIPDPRSVQAEPLHLQLVVENLFRADFKAAQAILDLMPDTIADRSPGLPMAVAAMRSPTALAAGNIADALHYMETANRLAATATDAHLARWLDSIAWLCWTETLIGRNRDALSLFDRAMTVGRSTGQSYIVGNLLAGQARASALLGRLGEAAALAEEAADVARMLGSSQDLGFATAQQCLAASWSGDDEVALRYGELGVRTAAGVQELWAGMARYAWAVALINAGRLDHGAAAMLEACNRFEAPLLDRVTLLSCCEILAQVAAGRGRSDEAITWADLAEKFARPNLEITMGFARLARAHATQHDDPATAAEHARQAADTFAAIELPIHTGRARLRAGISHADAGERGLAREQLQTAAQIFADCDARSMQAQARRELRRLVRVPPANERGHTPRPFGLSSRELEVATLAVKGHTNQQIADELFLSLSTIETHLSRIFTKLSVTSRVGMVNALQRQQLPEHTKPRDAT